MRIKRLQLVGFKSCMERAVLEFPRGITGVVGPNGCGKSNIVDALRWVLGEQSARHLRGQTMEDVIFAGNERYGALGGAEVSIVFDNEEGLPHLDASAPEDEPTIAAALRDAPEIEVTRRLFRSGESEYAINGRSCRLRDITELFLGTGVGTKAYSIVEQGRVGQIVGAKPEELRLYIEEAAGTTLYRSRKLAAERKIERTRNMPGLVAQQRVHRGVVPEEVAVLLAFGVEARVKVGPTAAGFKDANVPGKVGVQGERQLAQKHPKTGARHFKMRDHAQGVDAGVCAA